jgi:hypothetical protein
MDTTDNHGWKGGGDMSNVIFLGVGRNIRDIIFFQGCNGTVDNSQGRGDRHMYSGHQFLQENNDATDTSPGGGVGRRRGKPWRMTT